MGRQRKLLEDLAHADGQGRLKAAAEAEAESKAVGYKHLFLFFSRIRRLLKASNLNSRYQQLLVHLVR